MSQIVTINGKPLDLDWEPSLKVGTPPLWRPPININSRMVHGVTINGYDYPPCPSSTVLYLPGLPGQGATIWDRSKEGNDGTIDGAVWKRLPSGLWYLDYDGLDDFTTISNDATLNFAGLDFSMLVWAYLYVTGEYDGIIGKGAPHGASTNPGYQIVNDDRGGNNKIVFSIADDTDRRQSELANAPYVNAWHLYIMSHDHDGTSRFYIDEAEVGSNANAFTGGGVTNASDFEIGRRTAPLEGSNGKCLVARPRVLRGIAVSAETVTNIYQQERHLVGR